MVQAGGLTCIYRAMLFLWIAQASGIRCKEVCSRAPAHSQTECASTPVSPILESLTSPRSSWSDRKCLNKEGLDQHVKGLAVRLRGGVNETGEVVRKRTVCTMPGCGDRQMPVAGDCPYCTLKFCSSHRLPEVTSYSILIFDPIRPCFGAVCLSLEEWTLVAIDAESIFMSFPGPLMWEDRGLQRGGLPSQLAEALRGGKARSRAAGELWEEPKRLQTILTPTFDTVSIALTVSSVAAKVREGQLRTSSTAGSSGLLFCMSSTLTLGHRRRCSTSAAV